MDYSPWGHKKVGQDLVSKQQQPVEKRHGSQALAVDDRLWLALPRMEGNKGEGEWG